MIKQLAKLAIITISIIFANFSFAAELKIAAGGDGVTASHNLLILQDGSLWAWGDNSSGQLGIGTTGGTVNSPVQVGRDTDWVDVAAGYKFSLGLKADGSLWAWGDNISGQLGDSTGVTAGKNRPVKITTAIDANGNTVNFGNVVSFAAGYYHVVVVTSDGSLWAWGDNGFGQLGNGDQTGSDKLLPVQIGTETNWYKVAAGGFHSLAIKSDGTLYAFGNNSSGQLGYEEENVKCLSPLNVTSFSACTSYEVVTLTTPDRNLPTRVCTGAKAYSYAGVEGSTSLFLGKLSCTTSDTGWTMIDGGESHTVAIKNDGTLWAVGYNGNGQLGLGTVPPTQITKITRIGAETDWSDVKAGAYHTLAKKADNSLWATGFNFFGQLGTGDTSPKANFTQIGSDTNWTNIDASGYHSIGLKSTPSIFSWGRNNFGQLGDGTKTDSNVPKDISFSKISINPVSRINDFGTTDLFNETQGLEFVLKAVGFLPVNINSVSLSGDAADFILLENSCLNITLNIGQTCRIAYKFKPLTAGQKTLNVTLNSNDLIDPSITLQFIGVGRSFLNVSKAGNGIGIITSFPADINCGSTCSATYTTPKTILLYANADNGSEFAGWSGACSGTSTCSFDTTNNVSVVANFKESIPPTGSIIINNGDTYTNTPIVNLSLICNDSGSGCSDMQFSEDGINWSSYETFSATKTYSFTNQSEGEKTVFVRFRDRDGNASLVYSDSIILDKTPPITFFYPQPATFSTSQLITMYSNEPATIYYSTDGTTPTNIYIGAILVDSSKTLKFYAKDQAGNIESERTANYVIDQTPPVVSFTINNGNPVTNSRDVTLTITCSDPETSCSKMKFSEDGSNWTNPENFSSSKVFTLSAQDGQKAVFLTVQNGAGSWSSPVSRSIRLDTILPTVIASPGTGVYNTSQIVTLSSSEPSIIYYTTDGTTPTVSSNIYSNPIEITTTTTLKFFAVDSAGNAGNVVTSTYTIDQTPPEGSVTINNGFFATNNRNVTLSFNVSGLTDVTEVQIMNDVQPSDYTTNVYLYVSNMPWTLSTGDGLKVVYARFKNAAGNWSNFASDTIILDTINPVVIASKLSGTYNNTINVELSCTDETGSGCDKIYYTLDNSQPTSSSNQYVAPIPVSNNTVLKVVAFDKARNTSQTQVYNYSFDLTPPTGTIEINNGDLYTSSVYVTLTLSGSESSSQTKMQFSSDGVNWTAEEAYNTFKIYELSSEDGPKTVCVRYNDTAGNWSAPICDTIILDQSAPTTTISPTGHLYNSPQDITLYVNEPATICYTSDGTDPYYSTTKICADPSDQRVTFTINQTTSVKYVSYDRANNYDTVKTAFFEIDTTPPTGTIVINEGSVTKNTTVNITLNATDTNGVTAMQFSNDGINWTPEEAYSTSKTWSLTSGDGNKTVYVKFKDTAGNYSIPISANIKLDTTYPVLDISPKGSAYNTPKEIAITSNEQAYIFFTLDGTEPTLYSQIYISPIMVYETSTLKFLAIDTAGNTTPVRTEEYIIDVVPPVVTASVPGGLYNSARTVALNTNEPATIYYTINGTLPTINSTKYTNPITISESSTLKFIAIDAVGNVSDIVTEIYTIDTVPPTGSIKINDGANYTNQQQVNLTITAGDSSEVAYMEFSNDGATWSTPENYVTTKNYTLPTGDGIKTVYVRFTDNAGNVSDPVSSSIILDTTKPTGTININNGVVATNSQTVTLTLSASDANGVSKMEFSNDGNIWVSLESYATSKQWLLTPGDGEKTVYVRYYDTAGNVSDPIFKKIIYDTTGATGSISINNNATHTNSLNVILTINATSISGVSKMAFSNDGTTWSTPENYATTKNYTLPTGDGIKTVYVRFTDNAGNVSNPVSSSIILDTTKPTGTITINGGANYTNTTSVTLTLSATDNSGITKMEFSNDGTTWSTPENYVTTKNYSLPAGDGTKSVYVRFTDNAGNVSNPVSSSIILDTTKPTGTITINSGATHSNTTSVTLTLSATDNSGISKMEFSNDGTTWSTPENYVTTKNYSLPAGDGTKTVYVRFTDNAGNVSNPVSSSIILDTTKPTITYTPIPGYYNSDQTITLTASENSIIYYTVDGSNPTTLSQVYHSPITISNNTILKFFAKDLAGNTSITYTANYIIDKSMPAGSIEINNNNLFTISPNVTIMISAQDNNGIDKIQFSNDSQTWSDPEIFVTSKEWTLSSGDGEKTVYVKITDKAGNNAIFSDTITLDTTPPTGELSINDDASLTNSLLVNVKFQNVSTDVALMSFSNDGVNWSNFETFAISKNLTLSSGDGVKTIYAILKDKAGNLSAPITNTIYLDTIPPVTTISPASGKYSSNQIVTLTPNENGKTYYTLDGSNPSTASTVYNAPIEITTSTSIKFFSVDSAGNFEQVKTANYTIDKKPPIGTISINNNSAFTNNENVMLSISAEDATGVDKMQFSNDGVNWSNPENYSTLKTWMLALPNVDGTKTVYVRFIDSVNNVSDPISDTIILDKTKPAVTISPNPGIYNNNVNVTLSSNENGNIYYTLNGDTPTTVSLIYTSTFQLLNTTTVKYIAVDQAGNQSDVQSATFTIDKTPPTGTIVINEGGVTKNTAVNLTLNATDTNGVTAMQFSNDGINWTPEEAYSTSKTWSLTSGDGKKTVYTRFKDNAGNWSSPATAEVILDTTVPKTSASKAEGTYVGAISVVLSSNEQSVKIYYTTDGSEPTLFSNIYSSPIEISKTTILKFFAVDIAGNKENTNAITYSIKLNADITLLINNGASYTNSKNVTLNITSTKPVAEMQFSNNGSNWSDWIAFSNTATWTLDDNEGEKTVYASFKDIYGNTSDLVTTTIIYDKTPPVTTISTSGGLYNTPKQVTISVNEAQSKIYYTLDGTEPNKNSKIFSGPINIDKSLTLKYFAEDAAGNREQTRTEVYTIDTVLPTSSILINNGEQYTKNRDVTLLVIGEDANDVEQLQISNDGIQWSIPENFNGSVQKNWLLTYGDGEKTVYVRVKDTAGNWSLPTSAKITLDTTQPTTTPSVPEGTVNNAFLLTLTSDETATIYYSFDNGQTFKKYTESIAVTNDVTIKFYAVDNAGNVENEKTVTYSIDFQPPLNISVNNKNAYTNSENVVINFSFIKPELTEEETPVKMKFSNDGLTFSDEETFNTGKNWLLQGQDGEKTIYVKFKDKFGNWSKSFIQDVTKATIALDRTAPVTNIQPTPGIITTVPYMVTLTTDESNVTTYYSFDNGLTYNIYSAPITINSSKTVKYYSKDLAGNIEAEKTASYTVSIKPSLLFTINSGENSTNSTNVTLNVNATDTSQFSKIQFSNDGINWSGEQDFKVSNQWNLSSANGEKTVYMRIRDVYGNLSDVYTAKINLDNTPPIITPSLPAGTYYSTQTITLVSNEPADIYYTTDGSVPSILSPKYTAPITISSNTTLKYIGIDTLGNKTDVFQLIYNIIPAETITPVGNNGTASTREDGGDVTTNKDTTTGNPTIAVTYNFGILVKDLGGTPRSVKVFIADKPNPTSQDYVSYPLECTGDFANGANCTFSTKLGLAPTYKYYFEIVLSDGNTIKYPQDQNAFDGPKPELLNGYNIISVPRDIQNNSLTSSDAFGVTEVYRWVSEGTTTTTIRGRYEKLNSSDQIVLGEGYFVYKKQTNIPTDSVDLPNVTSSTVRVNLKAGWNLISNPYNGNVKLRDIRVINQSKNIGLNWLDAAKNNWIYNAAYYYKGADWGDVYDFETADGAKEGVLIPWLGYWIYVADGSGSYVLEIPKP